MSDAPQYMDFGNWLAQGGSLVQMQIPLRAQVQWSRILDRPTDIQFTRFGRELDPQTVRIEFDNTVSELNSGEVGQGSQRKGILFGIHGHPTEVDTDVAVWDTFSMDDMEFTVTFVNRQLDGQIQASFEAVA